ncbi:MAG TPA: HEAT repeat domain-containing protein [Gemmataceae bacterium]|nr:HEAT repeat domain-containing protein [Gemmataceae bacterium]
MVGQPARCPCCTMAFLVPSAPPRSAPAVAPPPAPRPTAVPPRQPPPTRSPAPRGDAPLPSPTGAAARKPSSYRRKTQTFPADAYDLSPEPPRSSRTLLLGLLSAGLMLFLGVVLAGIAVFVFRDQLFSPTRQESRGTPVAQADPDTSGKTATEPLSKTAPTNPIIQPDKSPRLDGDAPQGAVPVEKAVPKREAETRPSPRREEEEPEPPRETPKPASPPKKETPKPEPPAKVAPPPSDAPGKEDTPKTESLAKTGTTPLALPERRRLTGDEIYRRLVKSTVYVRNREGWGSGSLIHKQRKLILTNYHVVGDNAEVFVSFPRYDNSGKLIVSGDFYERAYKRKELIRGKVLKIAKGHDLALVELDKLPEGTPVVKLAARSASPGQAVHSVGNPGASDARWSYTSGTVRQVSHKTWRAKGEDKIHTFDADVVETQSPTNPGDSGGPLVNDMLQLVGVTQGATVTARELSLFIDIGEVKKLLQSCGVDLKEVTASPDDASGGGADTSDLFVLIKCLEDKDTKVRGEAAHRLAELGPRARPAARALTKALQDEEALVRQSAAVALGKLGPDAREQVRDAVFKALRDSDAGVRLAALEALANLGKPELAELPILLSVLRRSVERQQYKASLLVARSLAQLGPRAKDAVPELRELLKAEDRGVRIAAMSALRKIGPAARDAAPELVEALKDTDRVVRMQAAFALAVIDPSLTGTGREALRVLILALRLASETENNDAQAKERIKEISAVLVKIGEPVVERLLQAIDGEFRRGRGRSETAALDAKARETALKIIAEIGPAARSTQTMAALAKLQRGDPSRPVREAARQAYIAIQGSN